MINMRFMFALLASLAFAPFAVPSAALADSAQPAASAAVQTPAQASVPCPLPGDQKLSTAQVATECCKDHKGVCGCRAGKIICCDGTTSTQPGCTCHGDNGFVD